VPQPWEGRPPWSPRTALPTTTLVASMVAEPTPAGNVTQPSDEILNAFNATVKEDPRNPRWMDGEHSGDIEKCEPRSMPPANVPQHRPNDPTQNFFFFYLIHISHSSAQIWCIAHFLDGSATVRKAEKLFKRFLKPSPSVDLWKLYLTHVR